MTTKRMLRAYRMIVQQFNLDVQPSSPIDLIPRFGTRLGLDQPTITLATEIIMKLEGTQVVSGKHPSTIVASALYLASRLRGRKVTQREVSNAVGVLEVTIRKRYKEMKEYL
jgi:transcription initiation factor TFIIB